MPVAPIGIFDSGVGGLSVWQEIIKLMPACSTMYVSDNACCPYGPKPAEEVVERTKKISRFLIDQGCGLIVVACNTATAAAIDTLRATFDTPFVGMEPAVKPAALHSKTGVVGVLATKGTFGGRLYKETSQRFASNVHVIERVGDGLVELVEQGLMDAPQTIALLHQYIDPMMEAGADHLVLGCTHYPFLIPAIEQITQGRIVIVNPAPAVAQHTQLIWQQLIYSGSNKGITTPEYKFYATGSDAALEACYRRLEIKTLISTVFSHIYL